MDFDTMLYRPIAKGNDFDALMPKSNCNPTYTGIGDTDFSVTEMVAMVNDYADQTQKIANKLKSSSNEKTIIAIKNFVFNHFQYAADQDLQLLRSPACSWKQRFEGIDCKSYSILISCLLNNLNITNYLRKISQPGYEPSEFTHVYVVVPKNQQTANLQDGYYTIDGTLPTMQEPQFLEFKDTLMSLQHARLNAAATTLNPQGLAVSFTDIKSLFNIKNITNIKNLLTVLSCVVSTGYTASELNTHLDNTSIYFNKLIDKINAAVKSNNKAELGRSIAEFDAMSDFFVALTQVCKAKGWSSCVTSRINVNEKAFIFYRDVVGKALDAWIADNFTVDSSTNGTLTFQAAGLEQKHGLRYLCDYAKSTSITIQNFTPKPKAIPAFEITKYVADNPTNFQPVTFVQGLYNTVLDLSPATNTIPNGNGTINNSGQDYYDPLEPKPQSNQAGLGWAGFGIVAIGLYVAYNSSKKNTPTTKK
jgi:hypothetical protein